MNENLFYDRLHQRCPKQFLLEELETSEPNAILHALRFVFEIERVQKTNAYYCKTIIKTLLDNEWIFAKALTIINDGEDEIEISDYLYEKYIELLSVGKPNPMMKDVVRYRFEEEIKVKIEETPNLISAASTTGFRTWEAALYMGNFLIHKPLQELVIIQGQEKDKEKLNILEIGAGTGVVSLVLLQKYRKLVNKMYVTDGDSDLVETQLKRNFELNDELRENKPEIKLQRLWWGSDRVPEDIDLVVGADVTYDPTILPDLCKCLAECLAINRCKMCLLSATIRSESTVKLFSQECNKRGLKCITITSTEFEENNRVCMKKALQFKPLIAPIRIYKIMKQ
ncbi:CPA_1a_G0031230.mRNA.1.CDS.1 [Saccharomyces cerevisiae]|nr:CPA_1a_G0031230.mRNA.1.CDS.1 [Saccharomyces cerevisiae]CAI4571852.1 BBM_1a_G0030700.mRNA.1.CDS.1 [Saccharomyces cerevisiae]CAI7186309.1 BBM_1a_G0030700.mRNA.1.CDS.1 [Saccharomyces cerevisiae]CAI7371845.1 CPA_1a_G0031230.mRNA.1.CDS.1 [Saccharomyces cerevisiae]